MLCNASEGKVCFKFYRQVAYTRRAAKNAILETILRIRFWSCVNKSHSFPSCLVEGNFHHFLLPSPILVYSIAGNIEYNKQKPESELSSNLNCHNDSESNQRRLVATQNDTFSITGKRVQLRFRM